jgi:hypothetical protein
MDNSVEARLCIIGTNSTRLPLEAKDVVSELFVQSLCGRVTFVPATILLRGNRIVFLGMAKQQSTNPLVVVVVQRVKKNNHAEFLY